MPVYRYKAVAGSGEIIEGRMDAADRQAVVERLRDLGHLTIRADADADDGAAAASPSALFRRRRVGPRDLMLLTREMATLVGAGLPLDRSLMLMAELSERASVRAVVDEVLGRVKAGSSLADGLAAQPDVFPAFYVSMVRAGEAGGALDAVLARLADFLEQTHATREQIRSALTYPLLLLIMAGLTIVVLLTVVLPRFKAMFEDAGNALPAAARVIVAVGDAARDHGWLAGIALALSLLALDRWLRSSAGRARWDDWLLRLPVVGGLVRRVETARFARTLATLVGNGVPMLPALGMARDVVANTRIRAALEEISGSLKRGEGLAEPLARQGCFPRLAVRLVQVGEETGRLEPMLLKVADIYEQEARRSIARLMSLLVPALTIGLGVLIAAIMGAVMSALLSVYDLPL